MTELDLKGLAPKNHRWSHLTKSEIFDASYMPEPNSGCWLWVGTAYRTKGKDDQLRPVLSKDGLREYAYQYAYERYIGPVPDGTQICHRCNVSLCVNPDHIYAGSSLDNNRDAIAAGTHISVILRGKAEQRAKASGRVHAPRNRDWQALYKQRRAREAIRSLPSPSPAGEQ